MGEPLRTGKATGKKKNISGERWRGKWAVRDETNDWKGVWDFKVAWV